jgi:hypothetical protein
MIAAVVQHAGQLHLSDWYQREQAGEPLTFFESFHALLYL